MEIIKTEVNGPAVAVHETVVFRVKGELLLRADSTTYRVVTVEEVYYSDEFELGYGAGYEYNIVVTKLTKAGKPIGATHAMYLSNDVQDGILDALGIRRKVIGAGMPYAIKAILHI